MRTGRLRPKVSACLPLWRVHEPRRAGDFGFLFGHVHCLPRGAARLLEHVAAICQRRRSLCARRLRQTPPRRPVPGLTTKYVQRAQFRLCSRAASITTLRVNRLPLTAPHYRVAVQRKAADSEVPALRLAMAMVHVRINFGAGDMHASRGTQMDLPFPLS